MNGEVGFLGLRDYLKPNGVAQGTCTYPRADALIGDSPVFHLWSLGGIVVPGESNEAPKRES